MPSMQSSLPLPGVITPGTRGVAPRRSSRKALRMDTAVSQSWTYLSHGNSNKGKKSLHRSQMLGLFSVGIALKYRFP